MRLAVGFWHGVSMAQPQDAVERLANIGVKGVVLGPGEEGWTEAEIEGVRQSFEPNGVFVAEVAQYRHGFLASHDEARRQKGVKTVVKALQDARALQAHCVGVSSPFAESDWWSEKTWTLLCKSLGEVAVEAEALGVNLAFHPTNQGPLDAPEQLRRIVDDVGSPRMKVMLDPVNMFTHRTIYDTTDFLNFMFDLLGDVIIGAHAKDINLDISHWVLRLDEVPLGTGLLDYETYVKRLAELDESRDLVFIIEHFRDVGVSGTVASPTFVYYDTDVENTRAKQFIEAVGQKVGAKFN